MKCQVTVSLLRCMYAKQIATPYLLAKKLAKFAGVSERNMGYAGLKDRRAVTEQWFCLQMPGMETPDFSQFELDGVEILTVTRHNRKIRTGSLEGNYFDILLRGAEESDELKARLDFVANFGFPNYFTEQRFVGMAITSRKPCVGLKGKSR